MKIFPFSFPSSTGVCAVAEALQNAGHCNVALKLWPGCRHEILNELNRQEIMEYLLRWMKSIR